MEHKTEIPDYSPLSPAIHAAFSENQSRNPGIQEYWVSERHGWYIARDFLCAGAVAIGLPDGSQINRVDNKDNPRTLISTSRAINALDAAQTIAQNAEPSPFIVACTSAREAQSLNTDEDRCDWRYLSGIRNGDGFHVYCGGIEAAVTRAISYAPYADVVCYRASRLDLAEAQFFASAIRASFPYKQIAFGFSGSDQESLREFDSMYQARKLSRLGYDDCFLSISGAVIFASFSGKRPWALFDDTSRMSPV